MVSVSVASLKGLAQSLHKLSQNIFEEIPQYFEKGKDFLLQRYTEAPAVQFAIEMAFSGLDSHHPLLHFDTPVYSSSTNDSNQWIDMDG